MNEQRIREIANQASTHAEDTVDYYSGIVNGLTWEAKILKARDLKFAELTVKECIAQCEKNVDHEYLGWGSKLSAFNIKQHFGVEE